MELGLWSVTLPCEIAASYLPLHSHVFANVPRQGSVEGVLHGLNKPWRCVYMH